MEEKDYLGKMLELQDKLNSSVGMSQEKALKMEDKDLAFWIRNYCNALQAESSEVWEAAGGRWWRDLPEDWKDSVTEEVIDCWHFLMSIFLLLDIDSEKLYSLYHKKNQKNFERTDWHHHHVDVNGNKID